MSCPEPNGWMELFAVIGGVALATVCAIVYIKWCDRSLRS